MAKGPKNKLLLEIEETKRRKERENALPLPTLAQWRKLEGGCREYARRYEVFALLEWYHHTIYLPNRGFRAWLKRLWWRLRGKRFHLLSPFQHLHLRDQFEEEEAEREARALAQGELADAHRSGDIVPPGVN